MYWNYEKIEEQLYIDRFYSFFEENCGPDFTFTGESHDFWECVVVLDGEICVSADEKVYNLKSGEVILHAPLEFHKFHTNSDSFAHLLIFSFSLEGKLKNSLNQKIVALTGKERHIVNLLLEYSRHADRRTAGYLQILRSYVYLLLFGFAEDKAINEAATDFDSLVYQKAVSYLSDNLCRKVSITELAKYCNVGTTFLKNVFKKYSGLSIHKYFLKMQMRNALELLRSGKNVTEVSIHLGFCSQPYFSAAFKREFGFPPSEYDKLKYDKIK